MRRSILLLVGLTLVGSAARAQAGPGKLLERTAPAIVNLTVTLRSEMEGSGGQPEETTAEVLGTLVDPGGLILTWNSHLSAGRMAELFGGGMEARMKVEPVEVKVRIAGQEGERRAFLAAADSDLDLAFLQLEEPPKAGEAPLPFVDFARQSKVAIGDRVTVVARLSPAFDHAAFYDTVSVVGALERPRAAWLLGEGNATAIGLPYFGTDGAPAGVLVTLLSRTPTTETPNPSKMMAQLLSLGRGGSEAGSLGLVLLPAERVRGVIALARTRAAELLAERAAAPTATP